MNTHEAIATNTNAPDHDVSQAPFSSDAITSSPTTRKTRREPDKFNRFAWSDAVHADPETPINAKCLAYGIAKFVNGETGEACPSTVTLAETCGLSETWVRKVIPLLRDAGWMEVEFGSRGRGEGHCNRYRINTEKRTPCAVLSKPVKCAVKPHFSTLKAHPVCEEPFNHRKKEEGEKGISTDTYYVERSEISLDSLMDRIPVLPREKEALSPDAAPCPVNTSPSDTPVSFPTTETDSAPDGATIEDQNKPTESVSLGSSLISTPSCKSTTAAQDETAAAQSSEVIPMKMATAEDRLATRREYFAKLRRTYPLQPAAEAAEVEALLDRMLYDRHTFIPLVKAVREMSDGLRDGRVRHADVPTLKRFLHENWRKVHGVAISRIAA
jgi:hypothetical protein